MKRWNITAMYEDGTSISQRFCYCEGGDPCAERERQTALEAWARAQHSNCICWSVCVVAG